MRKKVSEKTLEINICAEILDWFRGFPRWHDAIWIGMKQYQEFRTGLDGFLYNAPGYHLLLQFKAPAPTPIDQSPYNFAIGGEQLLHLRRIASSQPTAVYYVFPFYKTLDRMKQVLKATPKPMPRSLGWQPRLLTDTWFLPVSKIPPGVVHRAECNSGIAKIYSEPVTVELHNWNSVFDKSFDIPDREAKWKHKLLPSRDLLAWISEIIEKHTPSQAAQIFRGLTTIYFPAQTGPIIDS